MNRTEWSVVVGAVVAVLGAAAMSWAAHHEAGLLERIAGSFEAAWAEGDAEVAAFSPEKDDSEG